MSIDMSAQPEIIDVPDGWIVKFPDGEKCFCNSILKRKNALATWGQKVRRAEHDGEARRITAENKRRIAETQEGVEEMERIQQEVQEAETEQPKKKKHGK